jgi:hypothetical protein
MGAAERLNSTAQFKSGTNWYFPEAWVLSTIVSKWLGTDNMLGIIGTFDGREGFRLIAERSTEGA